MLLRLLSAVAAVTSLVGCASEGVTGPAFLSLERPEYAAAFDAAVALAAEVGMPAEVEDRDGGVIESRPRVSGSLIEPWKWPNGSVGDATAATISYQRRRARFEFFPAGFRPTSLDESAALLGRRTPGSTGPNTAGGVDLATYEGPIEVRVSVYVERAFTPGLQRSSWTLSETSVSTNPLRPRPPRTTTSYDVSVWTPIERDPTMERHLLSMLDERMGRMRSESGKVDARVDEAVQDVHHQVEQDQHR